MTQPAPEMPEERKSGMLSASTGVHLNNVKVDLEVTPAHDQVKCDLTCNGVTAIITFLPDGTVDARIPAGSTGAYI